MKSFSIVFVSICCLFVTIKSAAVEVVGDELEKDKSQTPVTETALSDCLQPMETGRCLALFYRFAYDMETNECLEFIYGGCGGNLNNFETKEDCELKCLENDMLKTTVTPNTDINTTTDYK